MKRFAKNIVVYCALQLFSTLSLIEIQAKPEPSIQKQIDDSIASFPGRCPFPYSVDANGHRCGGNSAYLSSKKEFGYSPFCDPEDLGSSPLSLRQRRALKAHSSSEWPII